MQKTGYKYHMAAWAVLAVIVCSLSVRPANATIFNFSGSCDALFCPFFGFGSNGSAVTGQLELLDSAVGPGLTFANTDVVSLSLMFEFRDLNYTPPFFDSNMLAGPVGLFTASATAIEQIDITDSLGQTFAVNLGLEGSFLWSATDTGDDRARGTPVSFDIAPAPVPEPESMAMILFSLGSMVILARRRRRILVSRAR